MAGKAQFRKPQEVRTPEMGDCPAGYVVQLEKPGNHESNYFQGSEFLVYCQHPEDIIPHISHIIPGISLSQVPRDKEGKAQFDDTGDPFGDPEANVIFIWHGHDGLSAIAWHSYLQRIISKADFEKLQQYCEETFM